MTSDADVDTADDEIESLDASAPPPEPTVNLNGDPYKDFSNKYSD